MKVLLTSLWSISVCQKKNHKFCQNYPSSRKLFGDIPLLRRKNLLNDAMSAKFSRSAICMTLRSVVFSRNDASIIRNWFM